MTDMDDAMIIAAYTPPYRRGEVSRLARLWGVEAHHITHRARFLGLPSIMDEKFKRGKTKVWTDEEIRILRDHPELLHKQMSQLLLKHGFSRTASAIDTKRILMGWRAGIERDESEAGYTATGVGNLIGVHHSTVMRWVRMGLLKGAQEEGPGRSHKFRIGRHPLRTFLMKNIHLWEPGKTDKYWLVDLLTNP